MFEIFGNRKVELKEKGAYWIRCSWKTPVYGEVYIQFSLGLSLYFCVFLQCKWQTAGWGESSLGEKWGKWEWRRLGTAWWGAGGAAQKTLENIPCPTVPPLSISNELACWLQWPHWLWSVSDPQLYGQVYRVSPLLPPSQTPFGPPDFSSSLLVLIPVLKDGTYAGRRIH